MQVKKIQLKNLLEFINSNEFTKLVHKPISILRVKSYINNPHASGDDFVLYMAFVNEQLVGYRTVFSDVFISENKKQKFAWLSGNWVHPKFRRQQISSKLFNDVYKDWDGKLMYTNYSEASKAVYDKTKVFTLLKSLKGKRYYQRFCFATLLPPKASIFKIISPIFKISDWFLNLFFDIRFLFFKPKNEQLIVEVVTGKDATVVKFLMPFKQDELFQRNIAIYQWIQDFPWVKSAYEIKSASKKYHFSSYANFFESNFYKITTKDTDEIIAVINVSIKNKHLKIPYLYALPKNYDLVGDFILNLCKEQRIDYVTTYDKSLISRFKKIKTRFYRSKNFEQKYMISKSLLVSFPEIKHAKIQTGDGDGVFT